ncbi:MAG: XRE family transcriptional regulator [Methylococcaceae bacterium]
MNNTSSPQLVYSQSSFNRQMLTIARDYRNESQSSLSKKIGLSQAKLSKIENGLQIPDEKEISLFSKVLGFPESFFSQFVNIIGHPMSTHPAMYRKGASVGVKPLSKLTAEINIRLLNLRVFLNSIELEPTLILPQYPIEDNDDDPEYIAKKVRETWLLPKGPILNLTELVEKAGVVIFLCDFSYANVDGASIKVNGLPPCIFLNKDRPADRMRFSLAHELGHLIMHSQSSEKMEEEANIFASELLMPRNDIKREFGERLTLADLARLKKVWRVAMQALLYRARYIEAISENQSSYLWRQISMKGYRKQEPESTNIPYEKPRTIPDIVNVHKNELNYSIEELAQATNYFSEEFNSLYIESNQLKPKLKLVIK